MSGIQRMPTICEGVRTVSALSELPSPMIEDDYLQWIMHDIDQENGLDGTTTPTTTSLLRTTTNASHL